MLVVWRHDMILDIIQNNTLISKPEILKQSGMSAKEVERELKFLTEKELISCATTVAPMNGKIQLQQQYWSLMNLVMNNKTLAKHLRD